MIARAPSALARLVGAPYLPITPTFPLLGPFGAIPLPSRWRITFAPAVDLGPHGPEAADDRALVLDLSERDPRDDPGAARGDARPAAGGVPLERAPWVSSSNQTRSSAMRWTSSSG